MIDIDFIISRLCICFPPIVQSQNMADKSHSAYTVPCGAPNLILICSQDIQTGEMAWLSPLKGSALHFVQLEASNNTHRVVNFSIQIEEATTEK